MPKKSNESDAISDIIHGCPVLVTRGGRVWIEFPGGRVLELDAKEALVTLMTLEKYQDEIAVAAIGQLESERRSNATD